MAKTRPCTTKIDGLKQFSKYGLPFTTVISVIRMVSKLDSQTLQLLVCIVCVCVYVLFFILQQFY